MRRLGQRGDTIVEVLISLAVLSLVLGGAYSIVNSALRASRQAQERSEATKLAESQLENIKSFADPSATPGGSAFCLLADGMPTSNFDAGFSPGDYTVDTFAGYDANCRERNGLYNVFILRSGNDYTVNVRWDRIGGGKEQVIMVYRGYDES